MHHCTYFEPRPLLIERGKVEGLNQSCPPDENQKARKNAILDSARVVLSPKASSGRSIETFFGIKIPVSKNIYSVARDSAKFVSNFSEIIMDKLVPISPTSPFQEDFVLEYPCQNRVALYGVETKDTRQVIKPFNTAISAWTFPATLTWDLGLRCLASVGDDTRLPMFAFGFAEVADRVGEAASYSDQNSRNFVSQLVSSVGEIADKIIATDPHWTDVDIARALMASLKDPWPLKLQLATDSIYGTKDAETKALCSISVACWTKKTLTLVGCGNYYAHISDHAGERLIYGYSINEESYQPPLDRARTTESQFTSCIIHRKDIAGKILIISNIDVSEDLRFLRKSQPNLKSQPLPEIATAIQVRLIKTNKPGAVFSLVRLDDNGGMI